MRQCVSPVVKCLAMVNKIIYGDLSPIGSVKTHATAPIDQKRTITSFGDVLKAPIEQKV